MDFIEILIFIGCIMTGALVGYPLGYKFGRKSVFDEYDVVDYPADILEVEFLEEQR